MSDIDEPFRPPLMVYANTPAGECCWTFMGPIIQRAGRVGISVTADGALSVECDTLDHTICDLAEQLADDADNGDE